MNRRSFLLAAPAVIFTPGLLMPVKAAGFTSGLTVSPNVWPTPTAADLARMRESYLRMVDRAINPPLVAFGDGTVDIVASKRLAQSLLTMLSYYGRIVPPMRSTSVATISRD